MNEAKLEDFEIGEAQNKAETLFFAKNKKNGEALATKRIKFRDVASAKDAVSQLNNLFYNSNFAIIKPSAYVIHDEKTFAYL